MECTQHISLGVGADLSRPYMFVVVSWLIIRCVRVCLCRLVADLFAICGMAMCVRTIVRTYLFSGSIMSVQRCYAQ